MTGTKDAYLTFSEWLMKYYNKTPEELTEEEDEEFSAQGRGYNFKVLRSNRLKGG